MEGYRLRVANPEDTKNMTQYTKDRDNSTLSPNITDNLSPVHPNTFMKTRSMISDKDGKFEGVEKGHVVLRDDHFQGIIRTGEWNNED